MSERALVIGAGPNGLAAAIRLAEAGLETTVLEARAEPGGAVRTEELTLPGFHHDTFSSVYPAGVASPVFSRLPLAEHGLEWVHPEVCMAHPLDDGTAVGLYRDLERTAHSLEAQHSGDGRAWARFVGPYLRISARFATPCSPGFRPSEARSNCSHGPARWRRDSSGCSWPCPPGPWPIACLTRPAHAPGCSGPRLMETRRSPQVAQRWRPFTSTCWGTRWAGPAPAVALRR